MYHQNLRGLKHKIDDLTCSLIPMELHPYFICITKHYLIEQKLLIINHENYHLVSNFSCINNRRGECICVRSDTIMNTVAKNVSQFCKKKNFEACVVHIQISIWWFWPVFKFRSFDFEVLIRNLLCVVILISVWGSFIGVTNYMEVLQGCVGLTTTVPHTYI